MKKKVKLLAVVVILVCTMNSALAHCQIPCGIYDDATRFDLMREHVTTIEKSMTEIERIGKDEKPNNNQLVRWVQNKEFHADELAEIVTFYFMAQRVKTASESNKTEHTRFVEQITLLHQLLVQSMMAKQTTDTACCTQLSKLIDQFEIAYAHK